MNPSNPTPPEKNDRAARLAIWIISLAVLLLGSAPQIAGYAASGGAARYTGTLSNNLDQFSYYAKMRQGWEGKWLYEDRYSPEQSRPALLFVFYIFLGHLAKWAGLSIVGTYHAARIGCGAALIFAVDRMIRAAGLRGRTRVIAFALCFLGGGLGWIRGWDFGSLPIESRPLEYWLLEAYAFQSLANYPHFALATALIVAGLTEVMLTVPSRGSSPSIPRLGLWIYLLAWVHPRLLVNLVVVPLVFAAVAYLAFGVRSRTWIWILPTVIFVGLSPTLLMLASIYGDPVWKECANPVMLSPMPWQYFMGYGLLWPLAGWGAIRAWRSRRVELLLPIAWLIAGILLPYAPMDSQRRLIQGYNLPLSILAAYAIGEGGALSGFKPGLRRGAEWAVVFGLSLSTFSYLAWEWSRIERRSYPTFVSSAQFDAIEWIAAHVPPDAAVTLCSLQSGVLIPPYAGGRVVLGHWAESYRAAQREKDVKKFFDSATSDDWRAEFVGQHRIGYLLWGRFEKALGDYDPSKEGNIWRIAWKNEEITIFHRADQP